MYPSHDMTIKGQHNSAWLLSMPISTLPHDDTDIEEAINRDKRCHNYM